MKTKFPISINEAARLLQNGEVVAFPTETVYGLGADATSNEAVAKIFAAKGRPGDNPLIVHIGSLEQLSQVVSKITDKAKRLMDAFWPGALTIILPKQDGISQGVTAGLSTVGVRLPSNPVALELLRAVHLPIAAPSANVSGRPSPTRAVHVAEDLDGKIAGIVDGGETEVGLESTVIDCSVEPPVVLRPGGVTKEEIEAVIGPVLGAEALQDAAETPKSPGMKYRHYAPEAPMAIVEGNVDFFRHIIKEAQQEGKKVGILVAEENQSMYEAEVILTCGSKNDPASVARNLYDVLRAFNQYDIDVIYSESFAETGLGEAIMNRLRKAGGNQTLSPDTRRKKDS